MTMEVNWEGLENGVRAIPNNRHHGDIWVLFNLCLDLKESVRVLEERLTAHEQGAVNED